MLLGVKTVPPGLKIPDLAATLFSLLVIGKPPEYTEVYKQMGFFTALLVTVTNYKHTKDGKKETIKHRTTCVRIIAAIRKPSTQF